MIRGTRRGNRAARRAAQVKELLLSRRRAPVVWDAATLGNRAGMLGGLANAHAESTAHPRFFPRSPSVAAAACRRSAARSSYGGAAAEEDVLHESLHRAVCALHPRPPDPVTGTHIPRS